MIGREFKFDGASQPEPFVLSEGLIGIAEGLALQYEYSIGQVALSMVIDPALRFAPRFEKSGVEDDQNVTVYLVSFKRSAKMMYDICRLKPDWLDNLEEDLPAACGVVERISPQLRSGQMDHREIAAELAGLLSGIYLQQFYDSGIHLTENEMRNIQKTIDKLEGMSDTNESS